MKRSKYCKQSNLKEIVIMIVLTIGMLYIAHKPVIKAYAAEESFNNNIVNNWR